MYLEFAFNGEKVVLEYCRWEFLAVILFISEMGRCWKQESEEAEKIGASLVNWMMFSLSASSLQVKLYIQYTPSISSAD